MNKIQIKDLIFYIWEIERKWTALNDPQFTYWGNQSYRKLTDTELFESVALIEKQRSLRKTLRKEIGLWNYIKFCIAPIRFFMKHLSTNPPSGLK